MMFTWRVGGGRVGSGTEKLKHCACALTHSQRKGDSASKTSTNEPDNFPTSLERERERERTELARNHLYLTYFNSIILQ